MRSYGRLIAALLIAAAAVYLIFFLDDADTGSKQSETVIEAQNVNGAEAGQDVSVNEPETGNGKEADGGTQDGDSYKGIGAGGTAAKKTEIAEISAAEKAAVADKAESGETIIIESTAAKVGKVQETIDEAKPDNAAAAGSIENANAAAMQTEPIKADNTENADTGISSDEAIYTDQAEAVAVNIIRPTVTPGAISKLKELTESYGLSFETSSGYSFSRGKTGSESYESLMSRISESASFDSADELTKGYVLEASDPRDVIEGLYVYTPADRFPYIYEKSERKRTDIGKCSNIIELFVYGRDGLTIRNCVFENGFDIQLLSCKNVVIENCYFKGAEVGIYMKQCENITVRNCSFEMNSTGLPDHYEAIYLENGNHNIVVENCYIKATDSIKKVFRVGGLGRDVPPSSDVVFRNCRAEGCFYTALQVLNGRSGIRLEKCEFLFTDNKRLKTDQAHNVTIVMGKTAYNTAVSSSGCVFACEYDKKVAASHSNSFEDCRYIRIVR